MFPCLSVQVWQSKLNVELYLRSRLMFLQISTKIKVVLKSESWVVVECNEAIW
jgi:hypothetical protein